MEPNTVQLTEDVVEGLGSGNPFHRGSVVEIPNIGETDSHNGGHHLLSSCYMSYVSVHVNV